MGGKKSGLKYVIGSRRRDYYFWKEGNEGLDISKCLSLEEIKTLGSGALG